MSRPAHRRVLVDEHLAVHYLRDAQLDGFIPGWRHEGLRAHREWAIDLYWFSGYYSQPIPSWSLSKP
ncbi:hypothetical protein [Arthrobacter sp. StoSoilB5]|uniref:hypothetical protein n=1 Tax=Arthrobacter sp. StoSoilB5 TaxID=2830992 RepID=UPI001CC5ADB3|nr:hypothetical protein [Arthrobacter sp. StoSoilB5]